MYLCLIKLIRKGVCPMLLLSFSMLCFASGDHIWSFYYQKPGADVRLLTNIIKLNDSGSVVSSSVKLRVGHRKGLLSVSFGEGSELTLLNADAITRVELGGSNTIELPISLYSSSRGRYYLPVNALVELPGGQRFHRAMSVVVEVGEQAARISNKRADKDVMPVFVTPEGRAVKILPTQETIR